MVSRAEKVDVVVVGAGWNGLISAKTYLELQPSANVIIVDEQASIGGVWSREKIYPSLYAQIKHGLFEYSFYPMRHEGVTADGYVSGDTIHAYLNDFASDFGLVPRLRLGTRVSQVSRRAGGGWRLEVQHQRAIECDKLIYASGATSHPVVPAWPRSPGFSAPVIHSSETGSHLEALAKTPSATVVGGAKSSFDSVFLLLSNGTRVDWVIRDHGSGPLALMPPTLLGAVNTMDVVTTRFVALMGTTIMNTDGAARQFLQRTLLGRLLAHVFWLVVNWIADRHAGYSKSANASKLRPEPHGNGIYWANAGLGAASVPDFWKTVHEGRCTIHRSDIASLGHDNTIHLQNGTSFTTDYVVLSTGFDKSFHVFSESLQRELALVHDESQADKSTRLDTAADAAIDALLPSLKHTPFSGRSLEREHTAGGRKLLHGPSRHFRRLIVPALAAQGDRSIVFPGFIHSIYTPMVSEVQALWGAAFLLGLTEMPSQEAMDVEVAEWNAWTRKRYGAQGHKHAYAIFDFLAYIDLLLKDLGINPYRKQGWLRHLFTPAYPREYRGILSEFKASLPPAADASAACSTPELGASTPVSLASTPLPATPRNETLVPLANLDNQDESCSPSRLVVKDLDLSRIVA
ncbi:hypothetical protein CDD81_3700 [Ophiocordyceps australis]|uniref:Uncharacterized protein n=1 Tax=Ophiocordyceps australis TaxID=1399860 RepID=A0A2C5XW12_9HYPO|nr:hypothetical protein CDD81_3700 [Ophiocordyceps australis]